MTMRHILWSNLVASPRNVRKVKTGIETLAASIAADGLIHNLAVTARENGKYEVIAGERRRRAIVQLVRAGTWARSTVVPCEVRECEDATAISYAENAQRVAMHPADAIRAFATLSREGHDEAAIANRYGYEPREVRRMLALASLRTTALQSEVARDTRIAHAVLLDALLPMLRGHSPSHAVQLRAGSGIQQPMRTHDANDLEMASPFDGMATLHAEVPDQPKARFAWLLSLDEDATARLLAACAGALIDATEGKFADPSRMRSANRIARAVNLDMRQHWEGGIEFFDRLGKKALLEGLTEACGQAAADNCARLKRADFALACADRIPGRGWLPPALRTPAIEPEAGDTEEFDTFDDEDKGYLDYDPANDEDEFAVAAE